MNHIGETFLYDIDRVFPLKEIPAGEFSKASVSILKFHIKHFDAGLLGNVSYMYSNGLMKMESLIVNPLRIDMPLLSMDTILAMGNFSVYSEIYDTTVNGFDQNGCQKVKASLSAYPDVEAKPHWYDNIRLACSIAKKAKKADLEPLVKGLRSYLLVYLALAEKALVIKDPKILANKGRRCNAYVEGLLKNGGPSTDAFLKKYGKERTAKLYYEVLFGRA